MADDALTKELLRYRDTLTPDEQHTLDYLIRTYGADTITRRFESGGLQREIAYMRNL
jgi:hypothetical protein